MTALLACAALALAACDRGPAAPSSAASGPELAELAPEAEPTRAFSAANDATRTAAGDQLSVSVVTRLPEAAAADRGEGAPTEVLTLRGANGVAVEAELTGTADPSITVEGRTLRALMTLGVDATQTLVYRVTRAEGALCQAGAPSHIVVWEPNGPADVALKILPLTGAAPGESNARACGALDYRHA